MRRWVITTGRGEVYVTLAQTANQAAIDFNRKFAGLDIASIVEATEF